MRSEMVTIGGYDVGRVGDGTVRLTGPMAMGDPAELRAAIDRLDVR